MLLHTCCAPCLVHLATIHKPVLYFYNPNIHPEEEYLKRLNEVKKVAQKFNLTLVEGEYEKERWFELIRGYGKEPEGGKRCEICFKMRLEETAKKAKEMEFKVFATTLDVSIYKNSQLINRMGKNLAKKYDLQFYHLEIDKKKAYQKSYELSKELNLYRQKYCGCIFSKK